jgi:hypothetical protein
MALDPDPYRTLGLTRGASLDEVKRAYRRLAKINHPDAAGAGALPRFLAIQAAYEQLVGVSGPSGPAGRAGPASRAGPTGRTGSAGRAGPTARRSSAADGDRADPTRRAYGGRPREQRPGADPTAGTRPGTRPGTRRPSSGPPGGPPGAAADTGPSQARPGRGKATLGSTSYDGADTGPFEPDWGGASWYGTTSGTYWTINPKEYADPRKHGPEYQARARRAAGARDAASNEDPDGSGPSSGSPTHTTSSWWEDTAAGPRPEPDEPPVGETRRPGGRRPAGRGRRTGEGFRAAQPDGPVHHVGRATSAEPGPFDEPAPDPARAAIDLGRALTDPRSGGHRGRAVRAVLGWLPIALGLGWLVGELTGCGRFVATCDPTVGPLTTVGQGILLAILFLLPEVAAIAAGAALVLLAAATAASLVISATGSAADENARRAALAGLLAIAWLGGLAIALVRRLRSGPRPARPVS